jgi:hypothetical protein
MLRPRLLPLGSLAARSGADFCALMRGDTALRIRIEIDLAVNKSQGWRHKVRRVRGGALPQCTRGKNHAEHAG